MKSPAPAWRPGVASSPPHERKRRREEKKETEEARRKRGQWRAEPDGEKRERERKEKEDLSHYSLIFSRGSPRRKKLRAAYAPS